MSCIFMILLVPDWSKLTIATLNIYNLKQVVNSIFIYKRYQIDELIWCVNNKWTTTKTLCIYHSLMNKIDLPEHCRTLPCFTSDWVRLMDPIGETHGFILYYHLESLNWCPNNTYFPILQHITQRKSRNSSAYDAKSGRVSIL